MLRLTNPVRVENKETGVRLTIPGSAFDADVYTELDEAPNNPDGSPRAPEFPEPIEAKAPKVPVEQKGGDPAASSDGPEADTLKEN